MNVNKVVVMGRLTYDPEVRQSGNGKAYSRVSVAVNRCLYRGNTVRRIKEGQARSGSVCGSGRSGGRGEERRKRISCRPCGG